MSSSVLEVIASEKDDEKLKMKHVTWAQASSEICLGVDLEPDEWIKDSGCSKHITGNRKLFSTYKAYNGGNVIFSSNLRGNIIGKGTISNDSLNIDNVEHVDKLRFNLLSVGRGIRKKGLYVMKLGHKPKDKICLATIDENSTLWHRILGHANMYLIQSLASKEVVRNLHGLKLDQHFCDAYKIGKQAHASHKAKNAVKCKYVTRNMGNRRKNEENTDSYETLRRNPYDSVTPRDTSPASLHNIYSFYEFESSESESEDFGEMDVKTLTLEQYLALNLNNTRRRISNPEDATF
ncbi:retrovirus-related pol polyprotein from transposon TNT 1-94 [Tanacetum coccineum]